MSLKLVAQVLELDEISQADKLVFLALANHADENGACWPSIKVICKVACMKYRSAQYALERLEANGFIQRERRRRRDGTYSSFAFQIALDASGNICQWQNLPSAKSATPPVAKSAGQDSEPVSSINQSDTPPINPPQKRKRTYSPEFEEFWKAYPAKGRVAKPQCSAKYEARLKAGDFSHAEIMAAVRRYGTSKQVAEGFVCHMQTWLNQERWSHDYSEPENVFTSTINEILAEQS